MRIRTNKDYNIAAVIVTFNRKVYLERCLNAILTQTLKPTSVYIYDNASTDGTVDMVKSLGLYNTAKGETMYKYIYNQKNEGGAGGFHNGMRYAMNDGSYDALWVMDDDGVPDKNCLNNLSKWLVEYDYIAPIVLSDEDHITCSFVPNSKYKDFCLKSQDNILVENWASPFNGILFSSYLIRKIGYPKKDMFIWGDEINYHLRAIKAGLKPVTILNAKHYHPIDRQKLINDERTLGVTIVVDDKKIKQYCYIRNRVYNLHYNYSVYVAFKKSLELYKAYRNYYHSNGTRMLIADAVISGFIGYFGGHWRYLDTK